MQPIQDLLHRLQWDPAFGGGCIEIGYLDRIAGGIVRVAFANVQVKAGSPPMLDAVGPDGLACRVPLHRVREVWRDGVLIWQRRPDAMSP